MENKRGEGALGRRAFARLSPLRDRSRRISRSNYRSCLARSTPSLSRSLARSPSSSLSFLFPHSLSHPRTTSADRSQRSLEATVDLNGRAARSVPFCGILSLAVINLDGCVDCSQREPRSDGPVAGAPAMQSGYHPPVPTGGGLRVSRLCCERCSCFTPYLPTYPLTYLPLPL